MAEYDRINLLYKGQFLFVCLFVCVRVLYRNPDRRSHPDPRGPLMSPGTSKATRIQEYQVKTVRTVATVQSLFVASDPAWFGRSDGWGRLGLGTVATVARPC